MVCAAHKSDLVNETLLWLQSWTEETNEKRKFDVMEGIALPKPQVMDMLT